MKWIGSLIVLIGILTACSVSYKFNGASIDYAKTKTISFENFPNRSVGFVWGPMENMFNTALQDVYLQQTRLTQVRRGGDLQLSGEITNYDAANKGIGSDGYSNMVELRMTVRVNFVDKANPKNNFNNQQFSASREYKSSQQLSSVQDELVNQMIKDIVDQIFIGWGVGYLGNGATNVVFPLTMVCLAFALMFGDGASAYLSLKLGEKKKEEASKGVANGILISIIISVLLCVGILIFLPQLLNVFGCTENLEKYAVPYGGIIAIGLPFMMIGTTLNSIIRADGNPKYAMISMVSGAILNTILDPIFIFVFNMGVEGAAIATVISQFVTFLINILYIKRFKSVIIKKETFKLNFNVIKKVSSLGVSSFITQMSIVLVIACENNVLGKYGSDSKYGAEIPITVLGIVMKISQILNSIIIGIAAGAQPIIGYNYGAGKTKRVKETLKYVLLTSLGISTIAFILFQTIPDKLISIFGTGDENYMELA